MKTEVNKITSYSRKCNFSIDFAPNWSLQFHHEQPKINLQNKWQNQVGTQAAWDINTATQNFKKQENKAHAQLFFSHQDHTMARITHVPMVAALPPSRPPVGAPPREKAVRQNKTIIMLYTFHQSHLTSSLKLLTINFLWSQMVLRVSFTFHRSIETVFFFSSKCDLHVDCQINNKTSYAQESDIHVKCQINNKTKKISETCMWNDKSTIKDTNQFDVHIWNARSTKEETINIEIGEKYQMTGH